VPIDRDPLRVTSLPAQLQEPGIVSHMGVGNKDHGGLYPLVLGGQIAPLVRDVGGSLGLSRMISTMITSRRSASWPG